jgi:hypothetical protein
MVDDNEANAATDGSPETKFLESLYGDPLRSETSRTGRQLVLISAICIAVVLFNVRLQATSLIPLDFGNHVEVLPMLLSLGVLLLLMSFLVRAGTDLLRDLETAVFITNYIEGIRLKAAESGARAADQDMANAQYEEGDGYESEPEPWWEEYHKVKQETENAVAAAEARVGIRRLPRRLRQIRVVLEIVVPIVFAGVALCLSKSSLAAFGGALFDAFKPHVHM